MGLLAGFTGFAVLHRFDGAGFLFGFGVGLLGGTIRTGRCGDRPSSESILRVAGGGFGFGFAGTGGTAALPFTPTALRRSYYTAGAGFTVSGATSPISLVVDYEGEFAKDRKINGITGGLRLVF